MANPFQTLSFNGLGTQTIIVPAAGPGFVRGKLSLPTLTGGSSGASACLVTITQNSSNVYTGAAGAEGFYVNNLTFAAGDSIAIALTSSAAPDLLLNVIKGVGSIGLGN